MELTEKYISRFWTRVDKSGDCWIWTACKDRDGYGQFCTFINKQRKQHKAHRVSYFIENNNIVDSLLVLHTCDNPSCVNPKHLLQGTGQNNSDDMISKCRQARGEKDGNAKLTDSQVKQIRHWLSTGARQIDIAEVYSITQVLVSNIKLNKIWRHV